MQYRLRRLCQHFHQMSVRRKIKVRNDNIFLFINFIKTSWLPKRCETQFKGKSHSLDVVILSLIMVQPLSFWYFFLNVIPALFYFIFILSIVTIFFGRGGGD